MCRTLYARYAHTPIFHTVGTDVLFSMAVLIGKYLVQMIYKVVLDQLVKNRLLLYRLSSMMYVPTYVGVVRWAYAIQIPT